MLCTIPDTPEIYPTSYTLRVELNYLRSVAGHTFFGETPFRDWRVCCITAPLDLAEVDRYAPNLFCSGIMSMDVFSSSFSCIGVSDFEAPLRSDLDTLVVLSHLTACRA